MGRVYAVASGKGGVGKTTTTAVLGATLASAGASVAVVDADLGMANLGPALGVDDGPPTIHDVLAGEATVAAATREGPDGLAVLPGSRDLDAFADADPDRLGDVVGALADEYDHVLVDAGAGLSTDSLAPLRVADEVVLVSTPGRDALRNADKTAEVCRRLGTPVRGIVLTRADEEAAARARGIVDLEVLGTVPDDPAVPAALEAGTPLTRHAPESPAAAAYRDLARTLTGVDVPGPTGDETSAPAASGAEAAEAVEAVDAAEAVEATETIDGDSDRRSPTESEPGSDRPSADERAVETDAVAEDAADEADSDGEEATDEGPEPPHVAADDGDAGDEAGDGEEGDAGDEGDGEADEEDADGGKRGLLSRLFG